MSQFEAPVRTCVWRSCERSGQPTNDGRCPDCGIPTEPLQSFATATLTIDAEAALAERPLVRPLIVTTNEVPLHRITAVHGDVFGLVVMARDLFHNYAAGLRTVVGGEVKGYSELLTRSRDTARIRLWSEARALGANAVVAFRFDCSSIGEIMSEIAAYGTAVSVEKARDLIST